VTVKPARGSFSVKVAVIGLQSGGSTLASIDAGSCQTAGAQPTYVLGEIIAEGHGQGVLQVAVPHAYAPPAAGWKLTVTEGANPAATEGTVIACADLPSQPRS
jgi:hypothetical protein